MQDNSNNIVWQYLESGDWSNAVKEARKLVKLDPQNTENTNLLKYIGKIDDIAYLVVHGNEQEKAKSRNRLEDIAAAMPRLAEFGSFKSLLKSTKVLVVPTAQEKRAEPQRKNRRQWVLNSLLKNIDPIRQERVISNVVLVLILLLTVGLRLYDLGIESLWFDEAASLHESGLSIQGIANASNQPPLYSILLHSWINIFGMSETALRSLSAIFGIITVFLVYLVGKSIYNRKTGLLSAFLASISYYLIYYSQETRCYSLLLLLSTLSYLFFIRILQKKKIWYFVTYFLASALLCYTHVLGALIVVSQVFYFVLVHNKDRFLVLRYGAVLAAIIISCIPIIWLLYGKASLYYGSGFWISQPNFGTLLSTFKDLSGFVTVQSAIFIIFIILFVVSLLAVILKGNKSLGTFRSRLKILSPASEMDSFRKLLVTIIWLFVPIIILYVESQIMTPLYLTKYIIGISPALYIIAAKGLSSIKWSWLSNIILILIVVYSFIGLQRYYEKDVKEQWREASEYIVTHSQDEDVIIICAEYCLLALDYYYHGNLKEVGLIPEEPDIVITKIDKVIVSNKHRAFLVFSHYGSFLQIEDHYNTEDINMTVVNQQKLKGIDIILLEPK